MVEGEWAVTAAPHLRLSSTPPPAWPPAWPSEHPRPSRRCLRSRSGRAPYVAIPDDPLPARAALVDLANQMAEGKAPLPPNVALHVRRGVSVEQLRGAQGSEGVRVAGQSEAGPFALQVEVAVAHVGFRPDLALSRELQARSAQHLASPRLASPRIAACPPCSAPAVPAAALAVPLLWRGRVV